ncbi:hypothetical protein, partial [Actinophytocola sp.]|uniref:hypothetical protein n=1 Tax=Actinophytocola sp. TaxID=1872138 RepID=UPI002D7E9326
MPDKDPAVPGAGPPGQDGGVALAVVIAVAVTLSRHAGEILSPGGSGHLLGALLDAMLIVPVAAAAVWLGSRTAAAVGVRGTGPGARVTVAALMSLLFVPLFTPLAAALTPLHTMIGVAGGEAHAAHQAAGMDIAGWTSHGLWNAVAAQPVVLLATLLTLSVVGTVSEGLGLRRRHHPAFVATAVTLVPALIAGMFLAPVAFTAATAPAAQAASTGGCLTAPTRTYNVLAINIDITVDRFGDHDPFGFMFVQAEKLNEVRAQEAALQENGAEGSDGSGAKVTSGLGQDPIQPLVLRARLGECVQINLTNRLTSPPRGGPGFGDLPVYTQPGGVPSVSIDMAGVAYDAAAGAGGQAVGNNPANVMVPPGGTYSYRYFLDPLMGEGARVFRSGGDSAQLTAHGLFGTLVAEPAGSTWLDPDTGADRTNDRRFNSFAAIIRPGSGNAFREFTIMYHEIGDEQFSLRRPPRESDGDLDCFGPPDEFGSPLPMRDEGGPDNCGYNTNSYRPGSRAMNYRSEPFFRRLELQTFLGLQDESTLDAAESLVYGSYMNGDPATPRPRSYVGEPTKTRLVHAGFEQLHVHHLHGGGDRWPMNPNAVADNSAGGLQKNPPNNASSVMLDSQTIGPNEGYDLRHECGAGGCQQAVGDFLFHCHIAHHYIAGMWSFWRVFDTRQRDLAVLPGRAAPPSAVNSQGLIGRTIEGRTVVARANLTNPNTQTAVEDLVERQIPPRGVRLDSTDATVWDWQRGGSSASPLYFGEPEDETVWPDYESPTPGERPQILFNPNNGRPAFPMLKPHLGMRPPFAPSGHTGTAYLGDTTSSTRPDGLCPSNAPVRTYNVTGISVPVQETLRERDPNGMVYVLNEDKDRVLEDAESGRRAPDPLAIRSNVGDCVAITLTSELDPEIQPKVNMHTHFVQFDPQSSDGVITGLSFEQSVYPNTLEDRQMTASSPANATQVNVSNVDRLRVGIFVAVGSGKANIEIRRITEIRGTRLTFDRALGSAHATGDPVSVEFTQYRWYSDVDSGTVFWHDHVNGIESWAHGLFGAHIIEPRGSTYHDPRTGNQVRSGTIVDIRTTNLVGGG